MGQEIKLDKKDKEILFELDMNARIPLTQLAKKVKLSPQTTKYRIEQLEKRGIIRGYVTVFDVSKFGYLFHRIYIRYENVSPQDEEKIIEYLKKHENVVWFIPTTGRWDLEIIYAARNLIHLNNLLKELYKKFPNKLNNNVYSASLSNYHQGRAYLVDKKTHIKASIGGEPERAELDKTDKRIISLISQNAKLTNSEIGIKLNLNYKTVQQRIKKLEEKGVIQAYRTWIDFSKINAHYYKALINLKKYDIEDEKRVLDFCNQHPNITYLTTCIGPWNIELEIETLSEEQFLNILREFRNLMGSLVTDYETLIVMNEPKLNYCPFSSEL